MTESATSKPCPICKSNEALHERHLRNIELRRCKGCSFVYANMSIQQIEAANSEYDDSSAADYDSRQTSLDHTWFNQIAKRMTRICTGRRVLDIGCGNGLLLKQFVDMGWECVGIDLSPWSGTFAERYGFTLIKGRIEDADLAPHSFDLIVNTSTLEHIADPLPFVKTARGLLKPDGHMYMAGMPNYGSSSIRLGLSGFYGNMPPGHVNYFTPSTLRQLMHTAGIEAHEVSVRSYGLPEAFWFYDKLRELLRKLSSKKQGRATTQTARTPAAPGQAVALATLAYYYSGRPLGLGDKLEVEVQLT